MKEFDHPHVAKLVGEPLSGEGRQGTEPSVGSAKVRERSLGFPGESADGETASRVLAEIWPCSSCGVGFADPVPKGCTRRLLLWTEEGKEGTEKVLQGWRGSQSRPA